MLPSLVRLNPNRCNYSVLTFLHLVCGDVHGQYVRNFFWIVHFQAIDLVWVSTT